MSNTTAILLVILIAAIVLWLGGCTYRNAPKLECDTVTEVKRECHSEGGGKSIHILIENVKKVDE